MTTAHDHVPGCRCTDCLTLAAAMEDGVCAAVALPFLAGKTMVGQPGGGKRQVGGVASRRRARGCFPPKSIKNQPRGRACP